MDKAEYVAEEVNKQPRPPLATVAAKNQIGKPVTQPVFGFSGTGRTPFAPTPSSEAQTRNLPLAPPTLPPALSPGSPSTRTQPIRAPLRKINNPSSSDFSVVSNQDHKESDNEDKTGGLNNFLNKIGVPLRRLSSPLMSINKKQQREIRKSKSRDESQDYTVDGKSSNFSKLDLTEFDKRKIEFRKGRDMPFQKDSANGSAIGNGNISRSDSFEVPPPPPVPPPPLDPTPRSPRAPGLLRQALTPGNANPAAPLLKKDQIPASISTKSEADELEEALIEIDDFTKDLEDENGAKTGMIASALAKEALASAKKGFSEDTPLNLPKADPTESGKIVFKPKPRDSPPAEDAMTLSKTTPNSVAGTPRLLHKGVDDGIKPKSSSFSVSNKDKSKLTLLEDPGAVLSSSSSTQSNDLPRDTSPRGSIRKDTATKLLLNSKKGEWGVVDNVIRTADKKHLDFTMTDDAGFNALMFAIKDNRLVMAEKMIDSGADVNHKTKDGRTAAHIAATYSKDDMMKMLMDKKVDLNVPGGAKGQLPIHMACSRPSNQSLTLVQHLLKSTQVPGTDTRLLQDKNGCIPLHIAIESHSVGLSKELLSKEAEKQSRSQRKDTGETALHLAAKSKSPELCRLLAEAGALPNVQDNLGKTALHAVAENGDEQLLRILYGLRADANIADNEDRTPLHIAAENGHTSVVEILADKFKASITARTKDGSTLMHIASKGGHSTTALAFLKRGVPLNMPNRTGALGLHSAAAMGHNDVVKTLLNKGTNVDVKTKDNYTALHVAVQSSQPEVVETLLGHGADVHVRGGKLGETALHIAAGLGGKEAKLCADMLIKSGAEINVRQENGETALHVAARRGNPVMIKMLLDEGADPMATSKTPLHVGARYCHLEACKMLLKHVEDSRRKEEASMLVNQQTTEGETALHFAAEITKDQIHYEGEDGEVIALLIDNGGEINLATTMTTETVMHYACRSGNPDIIKNIVDKIGPGAVQIALNKQSKTGWSPLLESCAKGHKETVQVLLENNARVDVFDEGGKTGLHLAAENGHSDIADLLLKNKAFVNSKSKLGVTPLHLAAMYGHTQMVNVLINDHKATTESVTLDNQTPLHYAAKYGQLAVCSLLNNLGANINAKDSRGQTPLHLAAESDHPEVVKLFLKMQNNAGSLSSVDEHGFTCAHIAAMKGSLAAVKELLTIDKTMVIEAKTKTTESTTFHMAAAGGHKHIMKLLIAEGANIDDENANGMSALHLAAKNGHSQVLDVYEKQKWRLCSRKTGLNPLHVAAYYGKVEFVRAMLSYVPATARTEPPASHNPLIVKELATEYGLTPLHFAAQSGREDLVRLLLNFQGVQVDATSATMNVIPLHLAAQMGHIAVVGMLLSRSTQQLQVKDSRGRTALHLAAMNGHYEMVSLLIAQGCNINAMDQNGWTALHLATKAGHMKVTKLLLESSADPRAETRDGKVPLCFAATHNHINTLTYLMSQDHDTKALMEDRRFIFDLMVCGKSHNNKPIEEFILRSPAPIDTAVKLSSLYLDMSEKEKERAKDLSGVAVFCEQMAVELLSIAATEYNPALLLKAQDTRGKPFLDVLIENEQKEVVSHASVQRYLTDIWSGGIAWGFGKFTAFFFLVLFCPPAWVFFSLPLNNKVGRAPIIKFICHLVSHVYLTALLIIIVLNIHQRIYEVQNIWPHLVEWVLLFWLSGILVAELSSFGGRSGLGVIRLIVLFISAIAILFHIGAFLYPVFMMRGAPQVEKRQMIQTILYLKNQLFAFVLLFSFVQYLDYLTVHHLFGPWAIIIRDLMKDLTRFGVILMLFMAGFTLHVTSIFQPAFREKDEDSAQLMRLANPAETAEMLFFSLFGLVEPDNMPPLHLVPEFSKVILKLVFGIYMLVTLIVLINLLIAMMSDTYQRIQAQSDTEWKFGRAKLIRQMNKKSATPAPINILTKLMTLIKVVWRNKFNMCTMKAQDDLRHEENIDAYSMSGQDGRISPGTKMMESNEVNQKVELGDSSEWKIETVIPWDTVIDKYYIYQGALDASEVEEKNRLKEEMPDDKLDAEKMESILNAQIPNSKK